MVAATVTERVVTQSKGHNKSVVMKKKIYGMVADIKSVISQKVERCAHCRHETETCAKLYVRAGSNRTVCVEM